METLALRGIQFTKERGEDPIVDNGYREKSGKIPTDHPAWHIQHIHQ